MKREPINKEFLPEIRIETDGVTSHIYINDKEVEGVIGYHLHHDRGEEFPLPVLNIDIIGARMQVNTRLVPAMPEPLKSYYTQIDYGQAEYDILSLIYACTRSGINLDINKRTIEAIEKDLNIGLPYWDQAIIELTRKGYVTNTKYPEITKAGIEFLEDNQAYHKIEQYLKNPHNWMKE